MKQSAFNFGGTADRRQMSAGGIVLDSQCELRPYDRMEIEIKKGQIFEGLVERVDFPDKGIVITPLLICIVTTMCKSWSQICLRRLPRKEARHKILFGIPPPKCFCLP